LLGIGKVHFDLYSREAVVGGKQLCKHCGSAPRSIWPKVM